MEIKLHDAELKVMDVIWHEGTVSAKHIYETLKKKYKAPFRKSPSA